jgi:coenzyme F420 hydrogenase subunit beta
MNSDPGAIPKSSLSIAFTSRDLCTRCGTCVGACPFDALSLDPDFFPEVDPNRCTSCGKCSRACPGGTVNFASLARSTFGDRHVPADFDGMVRKTVFGRASSDETRRRGASGGAVTALLTHLLETRAVTGCLAVRMNPARPWHAEPFIARTHDELLPAAQSKYIVAPVNALLKAVRAVPGRYAAVMLPCQVHGLRKLAAEDAVVRDRIRCVVGLFCATTLEPNVGLELLRARNVDPAAVADLRFREGEWPGKICAVLKDGRTVPLHKSNFKDGAINYLTYLYSPPRCRVCLDGSCEFADISAGDAWGRDSTGAYSATGLTRMLVRTETGETVLESAVSAGVLALSDNHVTHGTATHKAHTRKKWITARLRIARMARAGRAVPDCDRAAVSAGIRDRVIERLETMLMSMSACSMFRVGLTGFLTSAAGMPLIAIRKSLKKTRYRRLPRA